MWAVLGDGSTKVLDNSSINVEKVVTGHTRLPWYTSWNDNEISSFKSFGQVIIAHVSNNLSNTSESHMNQFSEQVTNHDKSLFKI